MKIINKSRFSKKDILKIAKDAGIILSKKNEYLIIVEKGLKSDYGEASMITHPWGNHINYYIAIDNSSPLNIKSTLAHELKHIQQYQQLGFEKAKSVSLGFSYLDDPLEMEAVSFQQDYI